MGPDQCQTIEYSELSDSNYTDPTFLLVLFCYCPYIWAVKVIRGGFNLDFSFIYWFRDFRVLLCGIWSLHRWRTWWSMRQAVRTHHNVRCRDTTTVDVETLTENFVIDFWTWEYFCQMLQCQDFWSIRFKIKGILLYLLHTVTFTAYQIWTLLLWSTNHLFVGQHEVHRNCKRKLLQPSSEICNVSSFQKFYKSRFVHDMLKIRCNNWC